MNLSSRDKLLAGLFAFQLVAAATFGAILVHGLNTDKGTTQTVVSQGTVGGGSAIVGPSASAFPSGSLSPGATTGPVGSVVGPTTAAQASAAAAAGITSTGALKAGAPIKIGVLVTQTGAINFASSAQGTKAYIDRVNSQGGVNGHQIQLEIMDDQLDQARGQSAAQQMLADGAFAFAGWNAPNTENAIVPFLEQNKIPLIGAYGEYAEYHSQYSYAFTASYGHFGYEEARYLHSLGVKNPGLVFIDNGESHANAGEEKGFQDGWKSVGGSTIPKSNFFIEQPTQPTYDDVITSLQLGKVDGVATILDQTAYNRYQQAEDRHAYHPINLADPLFPDSTVTKESANNGTYVASDVDFIDTGGPEVQDYVNTVKQQFGSSAPTNWTGEVGWLDAKILVTALKTLGNNITRPGLMNAIDTMKPTGFGFTAPQTFETGPHDMNHCLEFGKYTGGKVVRTQTWTCDNEVF